MEATFWIVLVFGLLLMSQFLSASGNGSNSSRIERKLDLILNHLGLDPNQGVNEQIMELMKSGQKIQAIKLYREADRR